MRLGKRAVALGRGERVAMKMRGAGMRFLLITAATVFAVGAVVVLSGANGRPYQLEYACFDFEPAVAWKWQTPDTKMEGKDIYELCDKLNIHAVCEGSGVAGVFNYAGADGWELVGCWQTPARSNSQRMVYWFKRPR